jgi:hypothetical protein
MHRIIYDSKTVHSVQAESDSMTIKPEPYLYLVTSDLQAARLMLLLEGIDCALIDKELGLDPAKVAGFHNQTIPEIAIDGVVYFRQVDLVQLPILPDIEAFKLVFKVKYYRDEALTDYAGDVVPDKLRVLRADNTTMIEISPGVFEGEFDMFADPVKAGQSINIKFMLTHFVGVRAAEGRFD